MDSSNDQRSLRKKRVRSFNCFDEPGVKKPRLIANPIVHCRTKGDMISCLSDEVLIRILQLLPVTTVLLCQSVSKRWLALSTDAEVWQSLYWDQFVRPSIRKKDWKYAGHNNADYWTKQHKPKHPNSFSLTRSHDQQDVVSRIDWIARYRLRHNWSRGSADVTEIKLEEDRQNAICHTELDNKVPGADSLMVQIIDGKIVTVDHVSGLRVWNLQKNRASNKCIAQVALSNDGRSVPTALALDNTSEADIVNIAVGFKDGGFGIWKFNIRLLERDRVFMKTLSRPGSGEEGASLIAAAYSHPHLLTITEEQTVSLYVLERKRASTSNFDGGLLDVTNGASSTPDDPLAEIATTRLLTSLKSHTTWPPLSLSIRSTPYAIIASIAYALPTYSSGWSVGLQELHISHDVTVSHSRLASAIEPGFYPLLSPPYSVLRSQSSTTSSTPGTSHHAWLPTTPRPSCLSYSHPYLLASHPNNTLTLYLVTSTRNDLKISMARTLWGHTSSVSGAHVGGRGKAISISSGGEELRVWELEQGLISRRVGESVCVRAQKHGTGIESGGVRGRGKGHWIGFDDEVAIVLKGSVNGSKALVVYDFT